MRNKILVKPHHPISYEDEAASNPRYMPSREAEKMVCSRPLLRIAVMFAHILAQ